MDEVESARRLSEGYYQCSPLGFLSDSYFTSPQYGNQYGDQQNPTFVQLGSGIQYNDSGGVNYTASIPQFIETTSYQTYQSQNPMDLNVLSAENYQEGAYEQGRVNMSRGRGSTQLYGGFLASSPRRADTPSPPATTMKTCRSSKKDASKETNVQENSTRQRGRPRLDTRDQTATERRRTQIRLAQRAYRQRKETTISGLNKRVASLQKTIEEMNSTFMNFNARANASGIQNGNPALAKHLKSTADRLADLANSSTHESDAEEEDVDHVLSTQTLDVDEGRQHQSRRTATASGSSDRVPMLGYQTTFDEGADDDDGEIARRALASQDPLDGVPLLDWTATEEMQQYQVQVPATSDAIDEVLGQLQQYPVHVPNDNVFERNIMQSYPPNPDGNADEDLTHLDAALSSTKSLSRTPVPPGRTLYDFLSLPSPMTYSFQETSFARRLLRTSLETSYRLLTDPHSRPEDIERLCKFTWCFTNSPRIIGHIKGLMERTAKENLELWEVPAMHLGGAGLHYPRIGIDAGGGSPPAWWANAAPTGPLRPSQPETPVPDAMMIEQIVDRVGFDGEWFDSNDVEQYLRSRGLYLDGQSSVVELNDAEGSVPGFADPQVASATSPGASSSQESTGGPRSPRNTDVNWQDDAFLQGTDYLWNEDAANMFEAPDMNMDSQFSDINYSSPKAFSPTLDFNGLSGTVPIFNTKMKKFVDVEKFLNTIVQSSVCLGRTPGFRRAAVESALTLATTEHF